MYNLSDGLRLTNCGNNQTETVRLFPPRLTNCGNNQTETVRLFPPRLTNCGNNQTETVRLFPPRLTIIFYKPSSIFCFSK